MLSPRFCRLGAVLALAALTLPVLSDLATAQSTFSRGPRPSVTGQRPAPQGGGFQRGGGGGGYNAGAGIAAGAIIGLAAGAIIANEAAKAQAREDAIYEERLRARRRAAPPPRLIGAPPASVPPLRALSAVPPRAPMAIAAVPPASETRYIPDEVLVELRPNARIDATRLAQDLRLQLLSSDAVPLLDSTFHRYRIPDGRQVRNVVIALSRNGAVARVQPHYLFTLSEDAPKADAAPQAAVATATPAPNPMQYSATALHLPEAHRIAKGQSVLIAVIDSGVDVSHTELAGASIDSVDTLGETIVPDAHGTGMVGAIIARRDMTGVSPDAKILALRAFGGQKAEGTTLTIIKALDKAVEAKARIVNMSFAGPGDPALARALFSAREKGATLIAAMGNAGPKAPPAFPAADPNVLAVTAVDQNGKLFANANVGPHVGLATPGVDILLPAPNSSYQMATGTSVAAAHASGEAALLLEKAPDLPPLELRALMVSTAVPVPATRLDQTGGGLANPLAALEKLSAPASGATR